MPKNRNVWLCLLIVGTGCLSARHAADGPIAITAIPSPTNASLRGLSVPNANIVWASGTGGTVLRSIDGGATWQQRNVPNADSLDFRDIEAFDSLTAYVLSAGEDGRIYKTMDGGKTWQLQFKNETKTAFFDCFDFFDRNHGIAMSDPVDGRYIVIATTDGTTWRPIRGPNASVGEASFAANGSCLTIAGKRAFIATGGGPTARVFVVDKPGETWVPMTTPIPTGAPSAGIFALAFRDANNGIAIGGDYQKPGQEAVVAITTNAGRTWEPAGRTTYTSGAAISPNGRTIIAVGTPGTRVSNDDAQTWRTVDTLEYNAVQFANNQTAFAVGPRGRIAKIEVR